MREWYVDNARAPVVWIAAVVGGVATIDISRIIEDDHGSVLTTLWVRAGSRVSDFRVNLAKTAASAPPVASEPVADNPRRAGSGGGSASRGAVAGVVATLRRGVRSTCMAIIGDSTGTDTDEWFGIVGQAVGADFPKYTVRWVEWNTTAQDYDLPVVLQTGTAGGKRGVTLTSGAMKYGGVQQVGDQDIRAEFVPAAGWAPGGAAANRTIVSRYDTAARKWIFALTEAGLLRWTWSANGTADAGSVVSTAPVPFAAGTSGFVRVVFDVDNGASGNTATFYTSTDGVAWTQLGTPVVTAGVTTIATGVTIDYQIGAFGAAPTGFGNGTYYRVEIRAGAIATPGPVPVCPTMPEEWELGTTGSSMVVVGAPVLTLLCASVSGQNITYFNDSVRRARVNAPKGQDVVFLSTGHNEGNVANATWIVNYSGFVTNIKSLLPGVPLVPLTQNPTVTPQPPNGIESRAARGATLMTWAATQTGLYPIDTYEAFPTDPAALAALIESDGLHPTQGNGGTSGSDVWADFLYDLLFA